MAQPYQFLPGSLESGDLRRYLPPELADAVDAAPDAEAIGPYLLEAFVHLAAARYTITTYLPRMLVRQLLHERLENPWLRWLEGSLLFADLSGSTALAERLSALGREGTERVTDALNHIFGTMIGVIEAYGGDLITFGGDALLVFFGDERHPHTAAHAAVALQHALHDYIHEVPGVGAFPMHLHVGVESGPIAFASTGLTHARHGCVLGATVNRVAAAEGLAGPGEVVIGPSTAAALGDNMHGETVAPGFLRIHEARANYQPDFLPPEDPPLNPVPEEAIPQLLDDLSRISAYVPPALLERILADPQRPQIEAELRPVTVLFAQVTGLERVAELLPPEPAARAIQHYVAEMQEAIELFGGVVNKLDVADEGLKLVAIFGAPTAYEDHAERAALAALEMRERFEGLEHQLHVSKPTPDMPQLQQRIGLNLGTAFAGNVGSPSRKEYTVMGDAVNVAARVMSKAEWGEIWCSAAVVEVIGARLVCEERGMVALKGKAQPLPLFRVSARREGTADELHLADGPLIGRERELAWLREHVTAATQGHGRAVRIVGDAGVGKSRLTAALVEEARAAGFHVISAACFSYTSGIPYAAWGEWLKTRCGIVSGDGNAQRIRKLANELEKVGPEMAEWLPILGDLARLDIPENRLTRGLDPKMRQTRRFELIEQLFLHSTREKPLLVLFEDLHWADPISLDLWQHVASKLGDHPALLVGVHRPGLEHAEHAGTYVLRLNELSAEESSAMVATLSGAAGLPDSLLKQIVGRAAGNPLFLSELIHAITERSSPATSNWQSAIEELPDSLNGLLLARIDRLDEPSRNVLRVASVIGQRIPFGVLRSLQPIEQEALIRQLLRLDAYEMTALERVEPERVHMFRHALIQEVAYQSMLYARRRELHGRIGAYLERRYADNLDDYVGLIAHHYRLSDRYEKAIEYLLRAGHAASAVYANEEAIQSYQWALETLADDADRRAWEARDALGDVFATIGRYDDALAQYGALISVSPVTPEIAQRAHRKRGAVLEKQGQYAAALAELERAMEIAQAGAVSALATPMICADVALVYKRQGEYDKAIDACEQGLNGLTRDPRTREDEQIEARLHSELGGIYGMRGDYPRARQHFEHSLRIREMIDDLPGLTAAHNNLGYLWQLQSEYEKAIEHYEVAEEIARKINLRFMLVFANLNLAYSLISICKYGEAKQRCQEALQLSLDMNDQGNIAQSYHTLGMIYYYQGEYQLAQASFDNSVNINERLGAHYQKANSLMHLAQVQIALQNTPAALGTAGVALELARSLNAQRLIAESLNVFVEASLAAKETASARAMIDESLDLCAKIGSSYDTAIAYRLKGLLCAAAGEQFEPDFQQSVTILQKINDQFELARSHADYGMSLVETGQQDAGMAYLKQAQAAFITLGARGELYRLQSFFERSA